MNRDDAKEILLQIMEVFDGTETGCDDCPFHHITEDSSCPFNECAEYWELNEE